MDKKVLSPVIIEWNPNCSFVGGKEQYQVYSNGKLELFEISSKDSTLQNHEDKNIINIQPKRIRKSELLKDKEISNLTCLEWQSVGSSIGFSFNKIAYSLASGSICIFDWEKDTESAVNPGKVGGRTCNSLSWNKVTPQYLAAGFDKVRNEFSTVIYDIETSKSISDTTTGNSNLFLNYSFGEAITSVSWLYNDPHIIVSGTSKGWIRVYDMRTGKSSELSIRICNEDKLAKVKGIRCDPFNNNILSTFSENDLVKLVDFRRAGTITGTSGNKSASLSHTLSIQPSYLTTKVSGQQSTIIDVVWSPCRTGQLSIVMSDLNYIPIYNTLRSSTDSIIRSPVSLIQLPQNNMNGNVSIKAVSWSNRSSSAFVNPLPQPRMLVAINGGIIDISTIEQRALGFSPSLVFNQSASILNISKGFINDSMLVDNGEKLVDKNPSISLKSLLYLLEEPENVTIMMRMRANLGYSIDSAKNLQIFSDELDNIFENQPPGNLTNESVLQIQMQQSLDLYKIWEWLCRIEDNDLNLAYCSILDLIDTSVSTNETLDAITNSINELGLSIFNSMSRSKVLKLCGWLDTNNYDSEDLTFLVYKCNREDSFERAAAIALFHGCLSMAVEILQENCKNKLLPNIEDEFRHYNDFEDTTSSYSEIPDTFQENIKDEDSFENIEIPEEQGIGWDYPVTDSYLNIVSLVAMCLAGFPTPNSGLPIDSNSHKRATREKMWITMCENLIEQLKSIKRNASFYLIASCQFLISSLQEISSTSLTQSNELFSEILLNHHIYLEDRIAFACHSIHSTKNISLWLHTVLEKQVKLGKLDALLLTGLKTASSKFDYVDVLQNYLDRTCDIQTCALIACHSNSNSFRSVPTVSDSNHTSDRGFQWLYEYRNLLNRWEMFIERAQLDVSLGRKFRILESKSFIRNSLTSSTTKSHLNQSQHQQHLSQMTKKSTSKTSSNNLPRQIFSLPFHNTISHILLRCSYCATALPLDLGSQSSQTQQTQGAFLRKQRPLMNCCANCKKQLPRCYVCQLYMGLLNPNLEFHRVISQRRKLVDDAIQDYNENLASSIALDNEDTKNKVASKFATEYEDNSAQFQHAVSFGVSYINSIIRIEK